jgi:hypothetical protein
MELTAHQELMVLQELMELTVLQVLMEHQEPMVQTELAEQMEVGTNGTRY